MRTWFAIIVAPALALIDQSVAYALVGWACSHQTTLPVHATHAVFLVATLVGVVLATQAWRETRLLGAEPADAAKVQRHFLAGVGIAVAVISAGAVLAMWIAAWVISACVA